MSEVNKFDWPKVSKNTCPCIKQFLCEGENHFVLDDQDMNADLELWYASLEKDQIIIAGRDIVIDHNDALEMMSA